MVYILTLTLQLSNGDHPLITSEALKLSLRLPGPLNLETLETLLSEIPIEISLPISS